MNIGVTLHGFSESAAVSKLLRRATRIASGENLCATVDIDRIARKVHAILKEAVTRRVIIERYHGGSSAGVIRSMDESIEKIRKLLDEVLETRSEVERIVPPLILESHLRGTREGGLSVYLEEIAGT